MTIQATHIVYNGEMFLFTEPVLNVANRSFCYGDAIFETMHAYGTEIQFAENHFERLFKGLEVLKINFSFRPERIIKDVQRLLNRDKIFGGARIRLTVFRDSAGLFTPSENNGSYIISCQPLENDYFTLNQKGLHIGVYNEIKKQINPFSAFKTANSLLYIMAGIYCKENSWDDCLIKNEDNLILEGFHSNLFLVKNNTLYTPSISQGCVDGILRKQIFGIASSLNIRITDKIKISEELLLEADEVFLTNAIEGIRWVLAYKNRRYFNQMSKTLLDALNHRTFRL